MKSLIGLPKEKIIAFAKRKYGLKPEIVGEFADHLLGSSAKPSTVAKAFLSSDMKAIFEFASSEEKENLQKYLSLLHHHFPDDCWGSEKKYRTWRLAMCGISGN